ncbi:hypothetical protein A5320_01620 [Rheinheimera sp. SA_1]|nr:hypothetical protein A5320_01620 [Rheinheimera sp. SA_1]
MSNEHAFPQSEFKRPKVRLLWLGQCGLCYQIHPVRTTGNLANARKHLACATISVSINLLVEPFATAKITVEHA